jgi:anthranilate phosphoribosyltransferase
VADERVATRMAEVLRANGAERALIVHGGDGLDELTTTGPSNVVELRDGEVTSWVVDPVELGLPRVDREDLVGGDANINADLARRVLAGEQGPHRDIISLNAGAALLALDRVDDLAGGIAAARQAIDEGHAVGALAALVETSQREAATP